RGEESRRTPAAFLVPQLLAGRGIEASQPALHAKDNDLAGGDRRRAARAGGLSRGSRGRFFFVSVLPDFFAGGHVEAADHFADIFAREDEQLVANERGRSHAIADGHGPFLGQLFGPGGGRFEIGDFGIAISAAPLGPIGQGGAAEEESGQQDRQAMSSWHVLGSCLMSEIGSRQWPAG